MPDSDGPSKETLQVLYATFDDFAVRASAVRRAAAAAGALRHAIYERDRWRIAARCSVLGATVAEARQVAGGPDLERLTVLTAALPHRDDFGPWPDRRLCAILEAIDRAIGPVSPPGLQPIGKKERETTAEMARLHAAGYSHEEIARRFTRQGNPVSREAVKKRLKRRRRRG